MERVFSRVSESLKVSLGLILLAMVGLSVWNVIARYVFNAAILWADEIAVFGMIVLTWIGTIVVAIRASEISMELFVAAFPQKVRHILEIGRQLLVAVVSAWVSWLSWLYVEQLYRFGMKTDSAQLPAWTINAFITVSLVCIALIALWRAGRLLSGKRMVPPDAAEEGGTQS